MVLILKYDGWALTGAWDAIGGFFFSRPPTGGKFVNPPIWHLSPFLDQGLPPPPQFVPENLKNVNTKNCVKLITFKLKSTLKAYFMLKIAKMA